MVQKGLQKLVLCFWYLDLSFFSTAAEAQLFSAAPVDCVSVSHGFLDSAAKDHGKVLIPCLGTSRVQCTSFVVSSTFKDLLEEGTGGT